MRSVVEINILNAEVFILISVFPFPWWNKHLPRQNCRHSLDSNCERGSFRFIFTHRLVNSKSGPPFDLIRVQTQRGRQHGIIFITICCVPTTEFSIIIRLFQQHSTLKLLKFKNLLHCEILYSWMIKYFVLLILTFNRVKPSKCKF